VLSLPMDDAACECYVCTIDAFCTCPVPLLRDRTKQSPVLGMERGENA
jgi:hypothetical protein